MSANNTMRFTRTVTERGAVAIPPEVRDFLGNPEKIDFVHEDGRISITAHKKE